MESYASLPFTDDRQNKSNENKEDCHKWSSDSNKLCFECYACKKGYLDKQDQNWVTALSICVINSVVLLTFSCYFYSKNFEEPVLPSVSDSSLARSRPVTLFTPQEVTLCQHQVTTPTGSSQHSLVTRQ
ncbi:hypothetical protein HAX54_029045, partial [Datura stramonium]|nr:hypothetical protein [Datura stramonium]